MILGIKNHYYYGKDKSICDISISIDDLCDNRHDGECACYRMKTNMDVKVIHWLVKTEQTNS